MIVWVYLDDGNNSGYFCLEKLMALRYTYPYWLGTNVGYAPALMVGNGKPETIKIELVNVYYFNNQNKTKGLAD